MKTNTGPQNHPTLVYFFAKKKKKGRAKGVDPRSHWGSQAGDRLDSLGEACSGSSRELSQEEGRMQIGREKETVGHR